jgi:hypothetical protein
MLAAAGSQVVVRLHEGYLPLVEVGMVWALLMLATSTATLIVLALKR